MRNKLRRGSLKQQHKLETLLVGKFKLKPNSVKTLIELWKKILFVFKVFGELLLWIGTCSGAMMFLTMVMLCDFYLVWKPTIYTLLPGSDYKKAFRVAKKEVATFFQTHMKLYYNHEIDGKKYSIYSYSSLFIYQIFFGIIF